MLSNLPDGVSSATIERYFGEGTYEKTDDEIFFDLVKEWYSACRQNNAKWMDNCRYEMNELLNRKLKEERGPKC